MRILLDECVPRRLRGELPGHDARTVPEMGWSGKKTSELPRSMAARGFEALLTVDQNLRHQQNLQVVGVAVIVLVAASNRLADLVSLIPSVQAALGVGLDQFGRCRGDHRLTVGCSGPGHAGLLYRVVRRREAAGVAYPVTVAWQEHREPVAVACPGDLSRLLDGIASGAEREHPPLVMIHNEGGTLTIGLGAPVGTLNHIPPSNDPPYMICLGNPGAEGVIDFYLAGHHTQFLMRNTIPNEVARRAALEYAETGRLPASVAWEDV